MYIPTLVIWSSSSLLLSFSAGYSSFPYIIVTPGIEWESVPEQVPPKLLPYLPSSVKGEEGLRSDYVRWSEVSTHYSLLLYTMIGVVCIVGKFTVYKGQNSIIYVAKFDCPCLQYSL